MDVICFHHTDADGYAAGAIVRHIFEDCLMNEIDYQMEFPWDLVEKDEVVYIVDFSLKPDDMRKLLEITKNITWIDHHQTAIEELAEFDAQLDGVRKEGECGALLTWKYFGLGHPPPALLFIDDWDVFTRKMDPETTEFHYGLEIYDRNPLSAIWKQIFFSSDRAAYVSVILKAGATIKRYVENYNEDILRKFGYTIMFEGHRCIVLNTSKGSSLNFDSVKGQYPVMIVYQHNGRKYKVSLYTDDMDIDVSRICQKFGGGGQPGAAGFTCTELPWII